MSDVDAAVGYINISISDQDVHYDSDFPVAEVIFWLDVTKAMILNRVIQEDEAANG